MGIEVKNIVREYEINHESGKAGIKKRENKIALPGFLWVDSGRSLRFPPLKKGN